MTKVIQVSAVPPVLRLFQTMEILVLDDGLDNQKRNADFMSLKFIFLQKLLLIEAVKEGIS